MPMEKKVIIVCEGKNDVSYLNALQRFVENDIPLPPGQIDPFLRFIPFPELEGTCTGQYDKIVVAYRSATELFAPTSVEVWVDADIYIRNEMFNSDANKSNGTEYLNRPADVPIFFFSYHNFEDFVALHYDEKTFQAWKSNVLFVTSGAEELSHHDSPLTRTEYAPLFQKVFPHYSKKKRMPFELSTERLANLRRNLKDPDVQTMAQFFQPGIAFGEHLLWLFDETYPELIP